MLAADTVARLGGVRALAGVADEWGIKYPFAAAVRKSGMTGGALEMAWRNVVPQGRGITIAMANATKTREQYTAHVKPQAPASPIELIAGRGNKQPVGIGDWLPAFVNPGDNFCGIDRGVDRVRLAGTCIHGRGTITQILLETTIRAVDREGGNADTAILPPRCKGTLPDIIDGPTGPCTLLFDDGCPDDLAFVLQLDTWCLYLHDDGREALVCEAPGYNARVEQFE